MASVVRRISLLGIRLEIKKEMGGSLPPISFWTPCQAPPGPPQTIVVRLGAIQRAGLSLGVRLAYCSKARRSTFTAFGGKFFTPSQSPDRLSHATKGYFSAAFSSTGKRITLFSFIPAVVFWLQPDADVRVGHRAS